MAATIGEKRDRGTPALLVYLLIPTLFCIWVLSMPVFPSLDGPMHLYLVEIFRQLLTHTPGVYSDTYFIKHYLPPYSIYYYGLAGLSSVVSMETADKLMVCCFFVTFALGARSLSRAVGGEEKWAPFLSLPLLMNWPLMMGFVNYSLGTSLACFALATWCRGIGQPGKGRRVVFVALMTLTLLTHPVPWIFAISFIAFDLCVRVLRYRFVKLRGAAKNEAHYLGLDFGAAFFSSLGALYLAHFKNAPKAGEAVAGSRAKQTYAKTVLLKLHDFGRTHGITVFEGHRTLAYRLALLVLFAVALWLGVSHFRRAIRSGRWTLTETWMSFGLLFLLVLPLLPSNINGGLFFAERLTVLLYLTIMVAAAGALQEKTQLAAALALSSAAISLSSLALSIRYISPLSRDIATVWTAPRVSTDKPGLLIRLKEAPFPPELAYDGLTWAGAHYFRRNGYLLYNTTWIDSSIIPVQPRSERLPLLDGSFTMKPPEPGMPLMGTAAQEQATLARVGFAIAMPPEGSAPDQNPLSPIKDGTAAPAYTDQWSCLLHRTWDLCTPRDH